MRNVRNSLFETNSSSTHCMNIGREDINKLDIVHHVHFKATSECHEIYNSLNRKASFLYGALLNTKNKEYIEKLKEVLDKYNISYTFEECDDFKKFYPEDYYDIYEARYNFGNDIENFESNDIKEIFTPRRTQSVEEKILNYLFSEDSYLCYSLC